MKSKLSYANVTATVALFLSLGAGAYAVGIGRDDVKSRHIADGSIKSRDVKEGSLTGRDMQDETIDLRDIREDRLDTAQFARVGGAGGFCDPVGVEFVECATVAMTWEVPSDLLMVAAGGQSSNGAPASGRCRFIVDGVVVSGSVADPGEVSGDNSDGSAANGFALTTVAPSVPAGSHTISLQCNEASGDTFIDASISALALDAT